MNDGIGCFVRSFAFSQVFLSPIESLKTQNWDFYVFDKISVGSSIAAMITKLSHKNLYSLFMVACKIEEE